MKKHASIRSIKKSLNRQKRTTKFITAALLVNLATTSILVVRSYNLYDRLEELGKVIDGVKKGD